MAWVCRRARAAATRPSPARHCSTGRSTGRGRSSGPRRRPRLRGSRGRGACASPSRGAAARSGIRTTRPHSRGPPRRSSASAPSSAWSAAPALSLLDLEVLTARCFAAQEGATNWKDKAAKLGTHRSAKALHTRYLREIGRIIDRPRGERLAPTHRSSCAEHPAPCRRQRGQEAGPRAGRPAARRTAAPGPPARPRTGLREGRGGRPTAWQPRGAGGVCAPNRMIVHSKHSFGSCHHAPAAIVLSCSNRRAGTLVANPFLKPRSACSQQ